MPSPGFTQRVIVGVGDLAVSSSPDVILSTYALGSCIGVVAYDPFARVGGMLHLMLPDSTIAPAKAARQPAMFADTGLPLFLHALTGLKARLGQLRVYVAGGASMVAGHDPFRIGERNTRAALDLLARAGCPAPREDTGGFLNRTLHLELQNGNVTVKTPQAIAHCTLAA